VFCPLSRDLSKNPAATPIPIMSFLGNGPRGGSDAKFIPRSFWSARNLRPSQVAAPSCNETGAMSLAFTEGYKLEFYYYCYIIMLMVEGFCLSRSLRTRKIRKYICTVGSHIQ
jgi:hypothetical protein